MRMASVRVLTAIVVAVMLAGGGLATVRAGQVSGNRYVSPTYGYGLTWNSEFWSVSNEDSSDGVDTLVLRLGDGVGNFFLIGLPASQDPESCLVAIASGRADSGEFPGYGQVTGRVTPRAGQGGAGALFGYTLTTQSGDRNPLVQYVECRTLVPGQALLLITLEVIDEPSLYEAAILLYEDLIGSLRLPGGTQVEDESGNDRDATRGNEGERSTRDSDRSSTQRGSGVSGNVYTSPNFGYTITWDPAVWQVTDESYEDGGDYFEVTTISGTSIVSFIAAEGYGGNAATCRDDANAILGETEGIVSFTPTPHMNTGEPLIGGDSNLAFAIFDVTYTDGVSTLQARSYVQCRTLVAGRAVLALVWIVPTQLFNSDLAAFEGLLAGIDTSTASIIPQSSSSAGEGGSSRGSSGRDSEARTEDAEAELDEEDDVQVISDEDPATDDDDRDATDRNDESEDGAGGSRGRHGQEV